MLADMSLGLTRQVAAEAPKLFQLNRRIGQRDVIKLLVAVLRAFVDSIRAEHKPDPADLMEAAEYLALTYTHDSLKDLVLALKQARTSGSVKAYYNSLDMAAIYEVFKTYFEQKAQYLENEHRDQKAQGPGNDTHTVAALATTATVATMVARRLDPAHPNHESLRRKLTITKGKEARGLISPEQAAEQRRQVEQANYAHATRRQPQQPPLAP